MATTHLPNSYHLISRISHHIPHIIAYALLIIILSISACISKSDQATTSPSQATNQTVQIPAGWFLMGENDQRSSNNPQHRVYLDTFYIQTTEVNRGEFARFVKETGYRTDGWSQLSLENFRDYPITNTLWKDADTYCRWLGMRLPTEAEWEKAARGIDGRRYPWGNFWEMKKANTLESGKGGVLPVGSYPEGASPYGLLDMSGNAAEWVSDHYDSTFYTYSPDHNPTGPTEVLDHVLRGGSYNSPADWVTTYFRDSSHSAIPNPRAGFRCASSISAEK